MNGLLKTLVKPDWDDNPKRSEILHAANLLQIGEFQLIQLAYKVWYKENLPEKKINIIFSEYMITGIIPIWVTYYARDIIKMERANALNIHNENYEFIDASVGEEIVDGNKLNLTFTISESKKFYVERINILGNHITQENYIRNQLVVDEGDPFSTLLVNKSINNIKSCTPIIIS